MIILIESKLDNQEWNKNKVYEVYEQGTKVDSYEGQVISIVTLSVGVITIFGSKGKVLLEQVHRDEDNDGCQEQEEAYCGLSGASVVFIVGQILPIDIGSFRCSL